MKYRKRFAIFNLLAGLMVWMGSCKQEPSFEFIKKKDLLTFPSASSIALHKNELFIIGDDAAFILVMDSALNNYRTVRFLTDTSYRIPKDIKPDFEASFIKSNKGSAALFAFGSYAAPQREKLYIFSLPQLKKLDSLNTSVKKLLPANLEINLEGAALMDSIIVLANRGNLANPKNHFILLNPSINNPGITINLELKVESFVGISGLHYLEEEDRMLFTGSQEATSSTTADGAIGQSYLGWINNFSSKIKDSVIRPDHTVELSTLHSSFSKKKIESVTAEKISKDKYFLYFVSDDDAGHSEVYKLRLVF